MGNRIGSFLEGSRFVKPLLYSRAKAVEKEALKRGSNIITDILNKEPEQPVGNIFKNHFKEKIKNMTVWLGVKKKA